MNEHLHFAQMKQLERVSKALCAHNMQTWVVKTAADVVPLLKTLLHNGETVAKGGSMTLAECGVMDLLRSGAYNFLDTDTPNADKPALYRQAFSADTYFASANAVTEDGYIYEMDGNSNRIAALSYGPERVILIVGQNKVVANVKSARRRNATISAPANAHRLHCKTPCAATGECANCKSPDRVCCNELIMGPQRVVNRVKVILVGEALGY